MGDPATNNRWDWVQWYVEHGWPAIPLHSWNGSRCTCGKTDCPNAAKHPRTDHGLNDATTDRDKAGEFWRRWPDANIGIRTGPRPRGAGIFVVDIDPGRNGDESLAQLIAQHADLPYTVETITGGGGRHLMFAYPTTESGIVIRNRSDVLPGIDIRGDGGYIIVAPSRHESGSYYAWRDDQGPHDIEPAEAPAWLLELIRQPINGESTHSPVRSNDRASDHTADCLAALLRINMSDHNDGSKRLFTIACRCVEYDLSDHEALNVIRAYEKVRPFPRDWGDADIIRRLRDAEQHTQRGKAVQPKTLESKKASTGPADWPDPTPLPDDLLPVEPFDMAMLPTDLRAYVADVTERMQCPADFVAAALVCVLGAAISRRCGIRPKRQDDWLVIPNLWGYVVGRPSLLKTPAIKRPLSILQRMEAQANQRFKDGMAAYKQLKLVADAQQKALKKRIDKAVENGDDPASLAVELDRCTPAQPTRQRYITNDTTVEKLGELLNENPHGILVFRDELTGWLYLLERVGQEGARSFYLEAWDGTGRFTYDRIGRGTIDIEAACVSIFGGIQPGKIAPYVRGAVQGGKDDDGMLQRFQIAVWPDAPKQWRNVDRWPNTEAHQKVTALIERFLAMGDGMPGVHSDQEPDGIPWTRFDEPAQQAFDAWREKLELRLRSGQDHPAIESHLGKYRSLVPSLALVFHLCDHDGGPVGLPAVELAIRWAGYLESHARRIYGAAIAGEMVAAKTILKRIRDGRLKDNFTAREIYRANWAGLNDRQLVMDGLELLVDYGWIIAQDTDAAWGRPTTRYLIHPTALQEEQ